MKPIRTLLRTSLASLLGLSLAQAANVPMTVTVNTASSNASSIYGTSMTVRLYNGNVIAVTPVTSQSPSSSGSYYAFTYSFSIPDTNIGLAVSVGSATTTGTGNKYFTALFTAAASVTIPGESFPYSGSNATWPTSNTPTLPPPQTGDLTIRNFSTNPDYDLDFTMRLDIGGRNDTHVVILSETGPTTAPVPTLSHRFASQNGEWRWSLQTADTTPLEVKVMTLGATLSTPSSNILSLYSAGTNPAAAIKLDPGTGAEGTAKITIDGQPVLTQLAASLLYLTRAVADGRYLPADPGGRFTTNWSNTASGAYAVAMGNGSWATGSRSTAMGAWSAANGYASTAMGSSEASGSYSTAMGAAKAYNDCSTAMGAKSVANGYASTAMGAWSTANGNASTAMGGAYANGNLSTAMGAGAAYSDYATAMGAWSEAVGYASTAMGLQTTAQGRSQFVAGQYNLPQYLSPQMGNPSAWVLTDELFTIGNGIDYFHPSNAFVVKKNGDTAVSGKLTAQGDAHVAGAAQIDGLLNAQGDAYVVGTASFSGRVYLIAPQGDLSMGDFTSVAPATP